MPLIAVAIAFLLLNPIAVTSMQDEPAVQAARPQRTEAEARARAEENRRRRAEERRKTGAPVELVSDYPAAVVRPVPEETEIRASYDAAMAAGKYIHIDGRKHYATTNAAEYWAEGVQWWFFSNYGECFTGDVKVEMPQEFAAYDPQLNALIGRVFTTHRIEMDVFHGKRIRPVTCGGADRAR